MGFEQLFDRVEHNTKLSVVLFFQVCRETITVAFYGLVENAGLAALRRTSRVQLQYWDDPAVGRLIRLPYLEQKIVSQRRKARKEGELPPQEEGAEKAIFVERIVGEEPIEDYIELVPRNQCRTHHRLSRRKHWRGWPAQLCPTCARI